MTFSTIICFSLALFAGVYADGNLRIVGGVDTTVEKVPYIVSLRLNGLQFCGGSIISSRHILTAAHCLIRRQQYINEIIVVTGTSRSFGPEGVFHRVSRIAIHPGFTGRPVDHLRNDIAVLTLSTNIIFNRFIQRINLPLRDNHVRQTAKMSGWGCLSESSHQLSPILQRAYTVVLDNPSCSSLLRTANTPPVIPGQICAFQSRRCGTCNGDSGSPLTVNGEIIGVVSFGIPCARGYPDVFTRVFAYKNWILTVMAAPW